MKRKHGQTGDIIVEREKEKRANVKQRLTVAIVARYRENDYRKSARYIAR
jgi:hypothetical protein